MNLMRASLIGLLIFGAAHTASAQQTSVDVKRLPIDLARVTTKLRQSAATESHNGLHIRYTVDVYGQAPRIDMFTKQDNLATGPVPYGAPSHLEMLNHVTPQEFRAPVMDFSNLLRWLTDKASKK
jgi:hypothetical protein